MIDVSYGEPSMANPKAKHDAIATTIQDNEDREKKVK